MSIVIGKTLTRLLVENRITVKELAKQAGVPASTIAEWKSNRSPKNPVYLKNVARVLGVSIHYLLFGEEDESEPITKILREDFFSGTFELSIKRVKIKDKI